MSAEPGGATVAVIAGHAGVSVAAARPALDAHKKAGTATRVKGGRRGIAETWKLAAGQAAPSPDPDAAGTEEPAAGGQPVAEPADGTADAQPAAPR